jgi:hypothetical protein
MDIIEKDLMNTWNKCVELDKIMYKQGRINKRYKAQFERLNNKRIKLLKSYGINYNE